MVRVALTQQCQWAIIVALARDATVINIIMPWEQQSIITIYHIMPTGAYSVPLSRTESQSLDLAKSFATIRYNVNFITLGHSISDGRIFAVNISRS